MAKLGNMLLISTADSSVFVQLADNENNVHRVAVDGGPNSIHVQDQYNYAVGLLSTARAGKSSTIHCTALIIPKISQW